MSSVDSKLEKRESRAAMRWLIRKSGPKRRVDVLDKTDTRSQNAHQDLRNHSTRTQPNTHAEWDDLVIKNN